MKIETFITLLKHCKQSSYTTIHYPLKVVTWENHKVWKICNKSNEVCKTCGHEESGEKGVYLYLKQPIEHLTIFTTGLFYMMLIRKQKPYDYARWHECIAGKEFIENIENIQVWQKYDGEKLIGSPTISDNLPVNDNLCGETR
jgi:hypothetical protein